MGADKVQFYLMDLTYKVTGGKPQIYLFGRTIDGKQICVTDDSFLPYFYVIPKKGFEIWIMPSFVPSLLL